MKGKEKKKKIIRVRRWDVREGEKVEEKIRGRGGRGDIERRRRKKEWKRGGKRR
jgi:hypothetical protein